jgi:hypothetical protein
MVVGISTTTLAGDAGPAPSSRVSWGIYFPPPPEMMLFALLNCVLLAVQMPWMLTPAPRNKAADAKATKAISRVYSIKS